MGTSPRHKPIALTDSVESRQFEEAPGRWEHVVCQCQLPQAEEIRRKLAGNGSVWKCEGCSQQYRLTWQNNSSDPVASVMGAKVPHWEKIQPGDEGNKKKHK